MKVNLFLKQRFKFDSIAVQIESIHEQENCGFDCIDKEKVIDTNDISNDDDNRNEELEVTNGSS